MKEQFRFIMIFVLLMLLLSACKQKPSPESEYQKIPVPDANPSVYTTYTLTALGDGFPYETEIDWDSDFGKRDSADKTKSISFHGQTYECIYEESRRSFDSGTWYDTYTTGDFEFYLDAENGSFAGYWMNKDRLLKEERSLPDCDDPLTVAKRAVSEYVPVEEYRVERDADGRKDDTLYNYTFVKYLGDIRTSDRILVTISSKGVVRMLQMNNTGKFDDLQPSVVNQEELKKSIEYKLLYWYSDHFNYTYTVSKQTLGFSPEGDLIMVTYADAVVTAVNPESTNEYVIREGVGHKTTIIFDTVIPK